MKKTITLLLLTCLFFVNAQVTEILIPTDYFVPQSNIAGSSFTLCQKNGFLYVAGVNQQGYGRIFKINQNTNEVIPIIENSQFYLLNTSDISYIGEYSDKIFFWVWSNGICMVDTTNNTFTTNYLGTSNTSGQTGFAIFNGYAYNGYGEKKNIDTGVISNLTYFDGLQNQTIYAVSDFTVIGNEMIAKGTGLDAPLVSKLYKFDTNGNIFILSNTASTITTLPGEQKFFKLNSNYIYMRYEDPSKLIALPENSSIENNILTSNNYDQFFDLFKLSNKLYFYQQSDGSFIKRTDGNIIETSNLVANATYQPFGNMRFTSRNREFRNFLEFNNKVYSLLYDGSGSQTSPRHLISFDGNVTQTIGEFSEITGATIHNNQMFFQAVAYNSSAVGDWYNGIFRYDGANIYRLNLGTAEGYTNVYRGQILGYNNFLFFTNNSSIVKVDLNTVSSSLYISYYLSTQNSTKSTLKFYPNPAKSQLNFSEELSEIKLVDMSGKQVSAQKEKAKTINVEKLPKGNYLITAKDKNGKTVSEKFIKE